MSATHNESQPVRHDLPSPAQVRQFETAVELAACAHRGQIDKAGQPYILHPLRVMNRCSTLVERTVALLHDVIEDTDATLESLQQRGFDRQVLTALDAITKRPDEPYESYLRRVASNPLARRVKLADLEDNLDLRRLTRITAQDLPRLRKYQRSWRCLVEGDQ